MRARRAWWAALALVMAIGALGSVSAGEREFLARKWKVGISPNNAKHPFMVAWINEIKAEAAKYPNVETVIVDGNYDAVKQNNDIEDLISQKCDLIIMRPHQGPSAKPAVLDAKRAGVPLLIVERGVPVPLEDYVTYLKADGVGEGRLLGEAVAARVKGYALVAELRGIEGAPETAERGEGFREALKAHPGIRIVSSKTAGFQRYTALEVMDTILQANPKLDVVFAQNDEMALGALRAIKAAGRSGILLVGIDGQSDAFAAIRSGEMYATVIHPLQAKQAFDAAVRYLKGERLPSVIVTPSTLVTTANVDAVKPNY